MGIKERKEREKRGREKEIVRAAKKLILKHGVEGMSMNQVADLTELNKATLYLYFSGKEDLIDALVHEGLLALEKEFQEADRPSHSGLDKVLGLIKKTFEFYEQNPVYFQALNHQERRMPGQRSSTPFSVRGDEIAGKIFGLFREGLQQGMADGSIRKGLDIRQLTIFIYAHTYGVMHTIHAKADIYKDVLHMAPETVEKSALEFIAYVLKQETR